MCVVGKIDVGMVLENVLSCESHLVCFFFLWKPALHVFAFL